MSGMSPVLPRESYRAKAEEPEHQVGVANNPGDALDRLWASDHKVAMRRGLQVEEAQMVQRDDEMFIEPPN